MNIISLLVPSKPQGYVWGPGGLGRGLLERGKLGRFPLLLSVYSFTSLYWKLALAFVLWIFWTKMLSIIIPLMV